MKLTRVHTTALSYEDTGTILCKTEGRKERRNGCSHVWGSQQSWNGWECHRVLITNLRICLTANCAQDSQKDQNLPLQARLFTAPGLAFSCSVLFLKIC